MRTFGFTDRQLYHEMNPQVVVAMLVKEFGTSEDKPSLQDRLIYEEIRKEILMGKVVVDNYRSLVIDDILSADVKDGTNPNDFYDEEAKKSEEEMKSIVVCSCSQGSDSSDRSNSSQRSGSWYYPSPQHKFPRLLDEVKLAEA